MPEKNGEIQLSNDSDANKEWLDALYLLGQSIYALLHLLTYLHSWLGAYKTGNMIPKTVEDRAKVTINGIYCLHTKGRYVSLFVCMLPTAGRTAGPIKTKLVIATYVDPESVLVKVKVIWCHLANANKTPYRGPQGPRE